MATIYRKRTIRPSTRLKSSKGYKVKTSNVGLDDILIVEIDHENDYLICKYHFKGTDIADRDSIHFYGELQDNSVHITWATVQPFKTEVMHYTPG